MSYTEGQINKNDGETDLIIKLKLLLSLVNFNAIDVNRTKVWTRSLLIAMTWYKRNF